MYQFPPSLSLRSSLQRTQFCNQAGTNRPISYLARESAVARHGSRSSIGKQPVRRIHMPKGEGYPARILRCRLTKSRGAAKRGPGGPSDNYKDITRNEAHERGNTPPPSEFRWLITSAKTPLFSTSTTNSYFSLG